MKYTFDLPPTIKGIAEWQIANFKKDRTQLETLKRDLIWHPTANYDFYGGARGTTIDSRPTERNALAIVSDQYIRRMEIGVNAVEMALKGADQTDIRLVTLVYWSRSHSVVGAAMECHISKAAAYQRLNKILGLVAFGMGFINFGERTRKWKTG